MNSNNLQNRKSTHLHEYDYRVAGGYFVTICSFKKESIFSKIENGITIPTQIGEIVYKEWFRISIHRNYVTLHEDEFVLMPNHIHGIIWIDNCGYKEEITESKQTILKSRSLGAIIGQFKSKTSRVVNQIRNTPGSSIWQRNYYDHIIRNDMDLNTIRKYILDNPLLWDEDEENIRQ
jgi:REP element-mobilizing transposase RayT